MTHLYFHYTTDVPNIDLVVAGLTAQAGYHWCYWASIIQHRDPVRRSHPHVCLERFTIGCSWWICRWRRWKWSRWEQILIIFDESTNPKLREWRKKRKRRKRRKKRQLLQPPIHSILLGRWSRASHPRSCSWRRHACPLFFLSGGRAKPPSAGCTPVLRRPITNRRDTREEMCIDEIWACFATKPAVHVCPCQCPCPCPINHNHAPLSVDYRSLVTIGTTDDPQLKNNDQTHSSKKDNTKPTNNSHVVASVTCLLVL